MRRAALAVVAVGALSAVAALAIAQVRADCGPVSVGRERVGGGCECRPGFTEREDRGVPRCVPAPDASVDVVIAADRLEAGVVVVEQACPRNMELVDGRSFLVRGVGRQSVSSFCIDRTEVGQGEYRAQVGADASMAPDRAAACNQGGADHPINCVSWVQADRYCRSLGKRLPSESEWILAAVGNRSAWFPWGNERDPARACWGGSPDGTSGTCPLGAHRGDRSPDSVFGMAGNVSEWTACDRQRTNCAVLGGSWSSLHFPNITIPPQSVLEEDLEGTARDLLAPTTMSSNVGFRCAAAPQLRRR